MVPTPNGDCWTVVCPMGRLTLQFNCLTPGDPRNTCACPNGNSFIVCISKFQLLLQTVLHPVPIPRKRHSLINLSKDYYLQTRLALVSVLGPFGVHLLKFTLPSASVQFIFLHYPHHMVVTTRRDTFYAKRYRYKKRIFFLLDIDIIRESNCLSVYSSESSKAFKLATA